MHKYGTYGSWTLYSYYDDGSMDEYEYHANDSLSQLISYYASGAIKVLSEYDIFGNLNKNARFSEDGSIESWTEEKHDAGGNLIETEYNSDGSVFLRRYLTLMET